MQSPCDGGGGNTAPKVVVRGRKCAPTKNSNECPFFCKGYVLSHLVNFITVANLFSLPGTTDSAVPVTLCHAPVVTASASIRRSYPSQLLLNLVFVGTVIFRNEINLFAASAGANPSFHVDSRSKICSFEQINNLCSTNLLHKRSYNSLLYNNEE
jgi:hypothetical protein